MINMSQVDENNPSAKSELDLMFEQIDQTSLAAKYYKAFKQAAGKTLKSIIISCVVRLQSFMTPQVARLTGSDDIDLGSIGDKKNNPFYHHSTSRQDICLSCQHVIFTVV